MLALVLMSVWCLETDAELAARAEAEYRLGVERQLLGQRSRAHFQAAIAAYDTLRERGVESAALMRNLGNAHLIAGDLPRAILTYRLGLRNGDDAGLHRALESARELVVFAEGSRLGRPPETESTSRRVLVWCLAAGAWCAGCLMFTRSRMTRDARWLMFATVSTLVAVTASGWLMWTDRGPLRPIVVIATDETPLRRGNGLSFPPRHEGVLNRGVEAVKVFRRGEWLLIETAGGERGWVQLSALVME